MKRHSTLAALAAAPLMACASAPAAGDEPRTLGTVAEPAQVAIYYVGQKPQCTMVRITEVQASSEGGLRWAAWQVRGNAVVGARSRMVVPEPSRATYRRGILTGPAAVRVYQGLAVRLSDRCAI